MVTALPSIRQRHQLSQESNAAEEGRAEYNHPPTPLGKEKGAAAEAVVQPIACSNREQLEIETDYALCGESDVCAYTHAHKATRRCTLYIILITFMKNIKDTANDTERCYTTRLPIRLFLP